MNISIFYVQRKCDIRKDGSILRYSDEREEMAMEKVFEAINGVFSFIGPLSDFLWEFPTNFDWYSSIPILGNISFAIILLLGSGIFFQFQDRFYAGDLL